MSVYNSQIDLKSNEKTSLFQFTKEFVSRGRVFVDLAYAKAEVAVFQGVVKVEIVVSKMLEYQTVLCVKEARVRQLIESGVPFFACIEESKDKKSNMTHKDLAIWDNALNGFRFPDAHEIQYHILVESEVPMTIQEKLIFLVAIRQKIDLHFPHIHLQGFNRKICF